MPSPRDIALGVNRGSGGVAPKEFPPEDLGGFGPAADPNAVPREVDYRANPKNPPEGPVPARLKGG